MGLQNGRGGPGDVFTPTKRAESEKVLGMLMGGGRTVFE